MYSNLVNVVEMVNQHTIYHNVCTKILRREFLVNYNIKYESLIKHTNSVIYQDLIYN